MKLKSDICWIASIGLVAATLVLGVAPASASPADTATSYVVTTQTTGYDHVPSQETAPQSSASTIPQADGNRAFADITAADGIPTPAEADRLSALIAQTSKSAPGSATTLATGQYTYTCTGINGVAYAYTYANLSRCVGWVDAYINGSHIAHFSQTGQTATWSCTAGVATAVVSIFAFGVPVGWGVAGWVWSTYLLGQGCHGN